MQVTFIDLLVYPLFETWSELVYPEAQHILDNLSSTRQYWVCRVTNSPPPTLPGSPTSSTTPTTTPTTPSNYMNPHPLDDAVNHTGLALVKETCETAEPVADVTSRNPDSMNSPAADRRSVCHNTVSIACLYTSMTAHVYLLCSLSSLEYSAYLFFHFFTEIHTSLTELT